MTQLAKVRDRKKAIDEIRQRRSKRQLDAKRAELKTHPRRETATHLGDVSESRSTARVRKLNEEVLELIRS